MNKTPRSIDIDAELTQHPVTNSELLQVIDRLHSDILERRGGEAIDIDAIIAASRDERDDELYNLR